MKKKEKVGSSLPNIWFLRDPLPQADVGHTGHPDSRGYCWIDSEGAGTDRGLTFRWSVCVYALCDQGPAKQARKCTPLTNNCREFKAAGHDY